MGLQIVEEKTSNTLKILFSDRLDIDSIANLWKPSVESVANKNFSKLIIDLKDVTYCDVAGISLLQTLKRLQMQKSQQMQNVSLENLQPKFQQLLEYVEQTFAKQASREHPSPAKQLLLSGNNNILNYISEIVQESRKSVIFLGSVIYQMFLIFLHPKNLNWRDFWRAADNTGPQALPIIALIGFLIGLISTFQAAPSFGQFGAQIYIIDLVALGLVREMGPLMTAVLLAGRTASFFAAELGTMKINQEIDALTIMGLNSIQFLVVPRILAAVMVTPFLNVFFIVFGFIGLFIVMTTLDYPLDAFLNQIYNAIKIKDFLGGAVKSFSFGLVIAITGCLHGLKTKKDSEAVGISTTKAVVSGLIILVLVDGIFAAIYYVLDV
ncbi:MAG: MlaE family lipid ABC transporter permease subunit [Oligoflexia bacterium]|nr:MlaE family lipid ABC transporter permease subunit [Oligoflexia bacterium]